MRCITENFVNIILKNRSSEYLTRSKKKKKEVLIVISISVFIIIFNCHIVVNKLNTEQQPGIRRDKKLNISNHQTSHKFTPKYQDSTNALRPLLQTPARLLVLRQAALEHGRAMRDLKRITPAGYRVFGEWNEAVVVMDGEENRKCFFENNPRRDSSEWVRVGRGVNEPSEPIFIFSAYIEHNSKDSSYVVTLMGLTNEPFKGGYCRAWADDQQILSSLSVSHPLSSHRYKELIFTCFFKTSHKPTHVTIVSTLCSTPPLSLELVDTSEKNEKKRRFEAGNHYSSKQQENVRKLQKNKTHKDKKYEFTDCLSPLNNRYDDYPQLIEWIEVNLLLGVNHFVIYNHSSGSKVAKVLKHYSKRGLVDVVQWKVPVEVEGYPAEVAYYAQVLALNDCLYRSKKTSTYIVNTDLDEVIVPKLESNYRTMLQEIGGTQLVYSFKNVFFHSDTQGKHGPAKKLTLSTLRFQTRSKFIWPVNQRSKMIINTKASLPLMIHHPQNVHSFEVPSNQALLHHYRRQLWQDNREVETVEDASMNRFSEQLIRNVKRVYKNLKLT